MLLLPSHNACGILDGRQQWMNLCKTEGLWAHGALRSRNLTSLVLDGVALLQTGLVHNLGILLALWLLLKQQIAVMARKNVTQLRVMLQLFSFLAQESLCLVTQVLAIWPLDYSNVLYMQLLLKSIAKLQLAQNAATWTVLGGPRMIHITLLWHKQYRLPVCFQAQLKVSLPFPSWHTFRLPEELSHCRGACYGICRGFTAGRVQEKNFFCHGSCPLDNYVSQAKICIHPFGLPKESENLAWGRNGSVSFWQ